MKKILSFILLLAILLLSVLPGFAQTGVVIPLEEYTLQVPNVNALVVKPVGTPFLMPHPADSTQQILMQPIYYQLRRTSGKSAEEGNENIPMDMYLLINKFVTRTINPTDIAIINYFFSQAGWFMTAKMPEEQP